MATVNNRRVSVIRVRTQIFTCYLKNGEWLRAETKKGLSYAASGKFPTVTVEHVWITFGQEISDSGNRDQITITVAGEFSGSYANSLLGMKIQAQTELCCRLNSEF